VPVVLVGRDAEVEAAAKFLDQLERGPAAVAIEGEPGIGKTAVWRAVLELAVDRGYRALSTRPAEPEKRLSFSGLADLLGDIEPGRFDPLPLPQRQALDAALLRAEDVPAADPRAVFTAVLTLISSLAADAPLLLAVDDLHWLDPPSGRALQFAARRLKGQRIGFLVSLRRQEGGGYRDLLSSLGDVWTHQVELAPLTLAATHQMLKQRLGRVFRRPTLLAIQEASAGNPFFALEIARTVGDTELRPGAQLPVPDDVRALIRRRIEELPNATRRALLRAAALSQPTTTLVRGSLEPARKAGLVDELPDGRIAFTHPLYGTAVYEAASVDERRRTHLELAEQVSDIEQRARHLAFAATGPDEHVVDELDRAARQARSRGAPELAAELEELALGLTPPEDRQATQRRALTAAGHNFHAGALARSRGLLTSLLEDLEDVATRGRALRLLAHVRFREGSLTEAIELLRDAAELAVGEPDIEAQIEMDFLYFIANASFDFSTMRQHVDALGSYVERLSDPGLQAEALATVTMMGFLSGHGLDEATLKRALAREEPTRSTPTEFRPSLLAGYLNFYVGRFDRARSFLYPLLSQVRDGGEEGEMPVVLHHLVWLECWAGNTHEARVLSEEMLEAATLTESESFVGLAYAMRALVEAYAGRAERCRENVAAALGSAERSEYGLTGLWASYSLGFLELSIGNDAAASRALQPLIEPVEAMGIDEPIRCFYVPEGIEALIALGELDRAEGLTEALAARGRELGRPWALARSGRCRAQLLANRGELPAALSAVQEALLHHEQLPMPLEQGRSLLVKGEIERRAKHKALAKTSLEQAVAIFEDVGAPQWAERARAELARIGLRHSAAGELTPTERLVAALAASGLTNREVGARLFMSPKTVEANLARVYRKLDIHRRAELGAKLAVMASPQI
jgi:DNA-binding CsgD family transcriptional regulator